VRVFRKHPAVVLLLAAVLVLLGAGVFWLLERSGSEPSQGIGPLPTPPAPKPEASRDLVESDLPPTPVEKAYVRGRVVDPMGKPIVGARVRCALLEGLRVMAGSTDMAAEHDTITGETGDYAVESVLVDVKHIVRASAEGYLSVIREVTVPPEGLDSVDFVLKQASALSGSVVDADRHPVTHAVVVAASDAGRERR